MTPFDEVRRLIDLRTACKDGPVDQAIAQLEQFRKQAPQAWDQAKRDALHTAVKNQNVEATRALIGYGVQVDVPDEKGMTALMLACISNNRSDRMSAVCMSLIDSGASLNGRYHQYTNHTILHAAVVSELLEVCERLLKEGMDLMVRCKYGNTPLHMAANKADPRFALLFLLHGAEVDAITGEQGLTALQIASRYPEGHETVLALVAAGAKTEGLTSQFGARHSIGRTRLQAGVQLGEPWLIQKLLETDPKPETLDARLREACLQSEAAGKPVGAHLARSLYAAHLCRQWVQESCWTHTSLPADPKPEQNKSKTDATRHIGSKP